MSAHWGRPPQMLSGSLVFLSNSAILLCPARCIGAYVVTGIAYLLIAWIMLRSFSVIFSTCLSHLTYVCFRSSLILFCIFSLACKTQSYLYRLSLSTSVISPVLVGIPSIESNIPLCTNSFAHLFTPNYMLMSMPKMSTVLSSIY